MLGHFKISFSSWDFFFFKICLLLFMYILNHSLKSLNVARMFLLLSFMI